MITNKKGDVAMKKSKTALLLTSIVSLSTTAVVAPLSIYHHQQQTTKELASNARSSVVNYDLVTSFLDQGDLSKSALQAAVVNLSTTTTKASDIKTDKTNSLSVEQEALAKQKQAELLALFKVHNYTTAQINDYLVTNIPGYADAYNKAGQSLSVSVTTTSDTKRAVNQAFTSVLQDASSTVTSDKLTETINKITISRDVFVGLSVAAGITAAGFLIASLLSAGASASVGIGCAAASAALGAIASGLDFALFTYKEKTNALTAASALFDTYMLGHLLREIVKPIVEKALGVVATFT